MGSGSCLLQWGGLHGAGRLVEENTTRGPMGAGGNPVGQPQHTPLLGQGLPGKEANGK